MVKVIIGATMSLDGFMNDRNGSLGPLYPDLDELRETEMLQESIRSTGVAVMGMHTYDLAHVSMEILELERRRVLETPSRVDLAYRVVK